MATGNDIGLAQPSTVTHRLATITQDWNSTVRHQELQTIAGGESTLEIARVQATNPASTAMGLVVRVAGGPSSAADAVFRVNQGVGNSTAADFWNVNARSSAADLKATIYQSTATDLLGRMNQGVGNSSAGDFWNVKVHSSIQTAWANVAFSTAGHTTNTTVLSSAATTPYVSGFTAASTEQGPITCAFTAGSTVLWPFVLWAGGGIVNVSQHVPQQGFLFKGQADRPLEFRILSGSTGTIYLGVTYRQE